MTDNSKKLFNYLKDSKGIHLTAVDAAEDTGLSTASINLLFNNFIKKGWAKRTIATIQLKNGKQAEVKFLTLTDLGYTIDPDEN